MDCYKKKYLKYKKKYLDLKKISVGGAKREKQILPCDKLTNELTKSFGIEELKDYEFFNLRNLYNEATFKISNIEVFSGSVNYILKGIPVPPCSKEKREAFRLNLEFLYRKLEDGLLETWRDRKRDKTDDEAYSEFDLIYIKADPSLISDADKKKYEDLAGVQIFKVPKIGDMGILEVFGRSTSKSAFGTTVKYCLHKKDRNTGAVLGRLYEKVQWGTTSTFDADREAASAGGVEMKYGKYSFKYYKEYPIGNNDINYMMETLHLTHPSNIALIRGEITDPEISKEANEEIHKKWLLTITKNNHTYEAIVDVLKKGQDEVNKNQRKAFELYNKASKKFKCK